MVGVVADKVIVELEAKLDRYDANVRRSAEAFETNQRKTSAAIKKAENDIKKSQENIRSSLRSTAATLAAGFGIQKIAQLADGYTRFTNQLRLAGLEGSELQRVQAALFATAQRYGVELESLGTLYGRVAQSSKELGATNSQLLQFTNGVAAAIKVQGGNAASAQGALLQLSQALGGSVVRAEEFNSINEGARPILQAVANGIDRYAGSVAKLRADVINGKVSSAEFFQAFLSGSKQLEAQAAKANFTIGQSFTVLNNALGQYIGQTDQAMSFTARFATAITVLADNIGTVANAMAVIAVMIGSRYAAALVVATTAMARKTIATGVATAAETRLATVAGAVTTSLGRQSVVHVTTTATAGRLAAGLGAVAVAENVVTVSTTRMGAIMAGTTALAAGLGRGLLAAFGGPVGIAIAAITLALLNYSTTAEGASLDVAKLRETNADLQVTLDQVERYASGAAAGIAQVGANAANARGQVLAFAGAVGQAAAQLFNLAKQQRQTTFEQLRGSVHAMQPQRDAAQQELNDLRQSRLQGRDPTPKTAREAYLERTVTAIDRRIGTAISAADRLTKIPLQNFLTPAQREVGAGGRDVASEKELNRRNLILARRTKNKNAIQSEEATAFELAQYERYRKEKFTPDRAAEMSRKDRSDYESATARGNAATGGGGRKGGGKKGPSAETLARREAAEERDVAGEARAYAAAERQANNEIAAARADLANSAAMRAQIEKDRIEDERISREEEIAQRQKQGQLGEGAEADIRRLELQRLNNERARLETEVVDLNERERVRVEAKDATLANLQNEQELAEAWGSMAETADEQRGLALRLLDLSFQQEKLELEAIIASEKATQAQKDIAAERLKILAALRGAKTAQIEREHVGPFKKYMQEVDKSAAQLDEDYQRVAVSGLQALNDGIADAIMGTKSLGDVFHDIANQIIADLLRIAIQQLIIKPLSEMMGAETGWGGFGGGGGGGGSGGGGWLGFAKGLLSAGSAYFGGGGGGGMGSLSGGSAAIGMASGGHVPGGRFVHVNETGIEGWQPAQSGKVIPLGRMNTAAGGGGGAGAPAIVRLIVAPNQYFDLHVQNISGNVAVETVRAAAPGLTDLAVSETFRRASRPEM